MKRPNIERMQKHVAKSTPDTVERVFDMWRLDEQQRVDEWVARFGQKMILKHGDKLRELHTFTSERPIDIFFGGQVRVTVRAVLR